MANPAEFINEVKNEGKKVTWPTRKETVMTTIMVFIMVILAALFFLAVDQVFSVGVKYILGIGS